MRKYKQFRGAKSVLAICFANAEETYHHWHVFSSGADGICISFDKEALIKSLDGAPGFRTGPMQYEKVRALERRPELKHAELPFLKRKPYEPEQEYRIVFEDRNEKRSFINVSIDLTWIKTITLSPWMPRALQNSVSSTLKSIDGCENIRVIRSTLVGWGKWKAQADRAVP
ncbi:DUF2971 domain-containing protein [Cereibacter sphaeroides]|uniref:DUF2971 domain-containing protein n=1 Tax=Cereibacter sphaeroides TaxID=1063 RepID=UPI00140FE40B|nr:DUF2971 domain-containing protein [Cereibacter sphaeroides]